MRLSFDPSAVHAVDAREGSEGLGREKAGTQKPLRLFGIHRPRMAATTPSDLVEELQGLLDPGLSLTAIAATRHLVGLEIVAAQAVSDDPNDLAVAVRDLLTESAVQLDTEPHGPIARLLGLSTDTRSIPRKDRRRITAQMLFLSVDHFRREREDRLIEAVADHLYARDSAYRRRRVRDQSQPSYDPRLGIDWLAQHRTYLRIWTPVAAMRADLLLLVERLQQLHDDGRDPYDVDPDTRHWISDRLALVTWRLAQFSTAMREFVDEQGGLWLLSDPTKERDLAHAVWEIEAHLPLGEGDVSWLRLLLADARDGEFDPFADALIADPEQRPSLMAAWMEWARCPTESAVRREQGGRAPLPPADSCQLWLNAAAKFIQIIETDRNIHEANIADQSHNRMPIANGKSTGPNNRGESPDHDKRVY